MAMEGPYLFASSLVENPEGMMCQRQLKEAFGAESSYAIFLISEAMVFHPCRSFGCTLLHHPDQT